MYGFIVTPNTQPENSCHIVITKDGHPTLDEYNLYGTLERCEKAASAKVDEMNRYGSRVITSNAGLIAVECRGCDGKGVINGTPCAFCGGKSYERIPAPRHVVMKPQSGAILCMLERDDTLDDVRNEEEKS